MTAIFFAILVDQKSLKYYMMQIVSWMFYSSYLLLIKVFYRLKIFIQDDDIIHYALALQPHAVWYDPIKVCIIQLSISH